jgi:electron transport complex protein RnfC
VSLALLPSRVATFRHGVHPDELKEATRGLPIERMPFVDEYVLPLSQHTGAPSRPLVVPGDRVARGRMIAAPDGFLSTALHAPVTGTVRSIELRPHPNGVRLPAIVLRADPFDSQQFEPTSRKPHEALSAEETVRHVQEAGLVGLGGAAFPTHVKFRLPDGKRARFVIINGCECEPYLTCDHRVMVERPAEILRGLRIIKHQVGAERGYVGVELNKLDAIDALKQAADGDDAIEIVPLEVKYPQGAEKMLIDAIFRREVPSGRLPLDLEMIVNNVGTTAALADLFDRGQPLIERVVTVTGPGVRRPANLLVPLGTPLRALLDHCGGLHDDTTQVILGGPMMGMAQKNLDVPITKGTSGVLAFNRPVSMIQEDPCIRCGRCLESCPIFLNPSRLAALVRHERVEELGTLNVVDCCECASCSFVCPSHIPLVQLMRVGKAMVRQHESSR